MCQFKSSQRKLFLGIKLLFTEWLPVSDSLTILYMKKNEVKKIQWV
jgi:hypothetical protein